MEGSWLDWAGKVNDAIREAADKRGKDLERGEIVIVTIGQDGDCRAHFQDDIDKES